MSHLTSSHDTERRDCARLSMHKAMQIELSSGERLSGESLDISLGGVLLKVKGVPAAARENQSARLFLVLHDGEFSPGYPCIIIRRTDNSLGLQLDMKHAAAFGKQLTHGVFTRKAQD
jgi:c-di-GMP-binding flagellar brake protein YcgR